MLPIPLQPVYKQLYKFKAGKYPVSERASEACLSLPIFPSLPENNVEYVCEGIREYYREV